MRPQANISRGTLSRHRSASRNLLSQALRFHSEALLCALLWHICSFPKMMLTLTSSLPQEVHPTAKLVYISHKQDAFSFLSSSINVELRGEINTVEWVELWCKQTRNSSKISTIIFHTAGWVAQWVSYLALKPDVPNSPLSTLNRVTFWIELMTPYLLILPYMEAFPPQSWFQLPKTLYRVKKNSTKIYLMDSEAKYQDINMLINT